MTLPTIHSNGTGLQTLRDDYDKAADSLQTFIDAWGRIEFNARDYYVQGPDAYPSARDERDAINAKLCDVRAYLDTIREHLYSV